MNIFFSCTSLSDYLSHYLSLALSHSHTLTLSISHTLLLSLSLSLSLPLTFSVSKFIAWLLSSFTISIMVYIYLYPLISLVLPADLTSLLLPTSLLSSFLPHLFSPSQLTYVDLLYPSHLTYVTLAPHLLYSSTSLIFSFSSHFFPLVRIGWGPSSSDRLRAEQRGAVSTANTSARTLHTY